jgi:cytochrome c oxidase accessory protein FixG
MSEQQQRTQADDLYAEAEHWHLNTGGETIHAKRMAGKWRTIKWWAAATWIIFFLGPYLRWDDRQAVLFDIPNRQFHIFDITILPQDVWMLSLILLFFAILLAVVTSVAGRVWCGYFCFQTIWTDIFTWLDERFEGNPSQRRKLDKAGWSLDKIRRKTAKHAIWIVISALTGISFVAWFTDAYQLWHDYLTLQASTLAWGVLALFTVGTYVLAGFMREQTCFWLCPYARIQGVMYDRQTVLPTYDFTRGEPRGKLKRGQIEEGKGDCVDCGQCLAVCPTGIDIRHGQQEGCITCGLCIDACDSVMDKIGRPRGLVRYAALDEIEGKPVAPLIKRPRVLVYLTIILLAVGGILYGLTHLGTLELKVLHERSPLFVRQSDGSIQNKYQLKLLNKTDRDLPIAVSVTGPDGMTVIGNDRQLVALQGKVNTITLYIKIAGSGVTSERLPVTFTVTTLDGQSEVSYESMFFGPKR